MRFSAILVVLSAAFATTLAALLETRQTGYASCSLPCLTAYVPSSCSSADTGCLCRNQQFVSNTTACFEQNCTGSDLQQSIDAAIAMCRSVGVTLTSSASGPTSTSNPSSTRSNPSSTTSSPAPSSSSGGSNSAGSNSVNILFALSALGLIGYAL